jgi:glutaredoxin-related protein
MRGAKRPLDDADRRDVLLVPDGGRAPNAELVLQIDLLAGDPFQIYAIVVRDDGTVCAPSLDAIAVRNDDAVIDTADGRCRVLFAVRIPELLGAPALRAGRLMSTTHMGKQGFRRQLVRRVDYEEPDTAAGRNKNGKLARGPTPWFSLGVLPDVVRAMCDTDRGSAARLTHQHLHAALDRVRNTPSELLRRFARGTEGSARAPAAAPAETACAPVRLAYERLSAVTGESLHRLLHDCAAVPRMLTALAHCGRDDVFHVLRYGKAMSDCVLAGARLGALESVWLHALRAAVFSARSKIRLLNLGCNELAPGDIPALFGGQPRVLELQQLKLDGNDRLADAGLSALLEVLEEAVVCGGPLELRVLVLPRCGIGGTAAGPATLRRLGALLRSSCHGFYELNLAQNRITTAGLVALELAALQAELLCRGGGTGGLCKVFLEGNCIDALPADMIDWLCDHPHAASFASFDLHANALDPEMLPEATRARLRGATARNITFFPPECQRQPAPRVCERRLSLREPMIGCGSANVTREPSTAPSACAGAASQQRVAGDVPVGFASPRATLPALDARGAPPDAAAVDELAEMERLCDAMSRTRGWLLLLRGSLPRLQCTWSAKAVDLLRAEHLPFAWANVYDHRQLQYALMTHTGYDRYPIVFFDGAFVGGVIALRIKLAELRAAAETPRVWLARDEACDQSMARQRALALAVELAAMPSDDAPFGTPVRAVGGPVLAPGGGAAPIGGVAGLDSPQMIFNGGRRELFGSAPTDLAHEHAAEAPDACSDLMIDVAELESYLFGAPAPD